MNNKGFTLIELLITVAIISLVTIISISIIRGTLALGDENAYEIMKTNVIDSANTYLFECSNNLIDCNGEFTWEDNNTSFLVSNLIAHGYFYYESLINPITKRNISNCLLIEVTRDDLFNYNITLDDSSC